MDTLIQDLKYAVRSLRNQRSTTAIAVICLALGIGANTAIFSVVRAVLLDALPYREPSRLVRLYEAGIFNGTRGLGSVSVPNYFDIKARNTVFESMSAYSASSADLVGDDGQPERVRWTRSTWELFDVLGAKPILGRTFAAGEDQPGHNVVVLSEGFWRRRFAGDRGIVGKQMTLNNTPYTVIGVMPASFDFPVTASRNDMWVPLLYSEQDRTQRGNHWLQVVGRLKPGLDSISSNARLAPLAAQLSHDYPEQQKDRDLLTIPLGNVFIGRVRPALLLLVGAVSVVLLIACANVANLLLARAAGRTREVAVRTALGAERSRLVRQLLTESVLLAVIGGAMGLIVAWLGLRGILAFATSALPRADAIHLDGRVLLFALGVSAFTGVLFGIVPALRASDIDLRQDLTDTAGRGGTSRRQHRTLNTFIAAEISLSLVLLIGAGLVVRAFGALVNTDPGFKPEHVLTFHISPPAGQMNDTARYSAFFGPLSERLRAIPDVRAVSLTTILPIQNSGTNGFFDIIGRPQETNIARRPYAEFRAVDNDFFRVMGIPLKQGREFNANDVLGREPVIMVNETFVKRYFTEDVIGKQVNPWSSKPATIIGVVGAVRQAGLEREPLPEVYVPVQQQPWRLGNMTFVLATQGDPGSLVPSVRQAVREIAPRQPLSQVQTMEQVISESLQQRKLTLSLLAIFAVLATALSAAGVYGVMSYAVTQRTREIGIRMALGAGTGSVTRMVLLDAGRLVAIGVAIGLGAALLLTRFVAGMLYGVGQRDPATFAGVTAIIGSVALLASVLPALRAARVDPLAAMRVD